MSDHDDIEGIVIDDVIDMQHVGNDDSFAIVMRSGGGIVGLVFSPALAREAAALLLRGANEAAASWTILTMVGTWVADSAAYVFGTRYGKHKMAPRLSPNKSWEGYFSGVVVGTAITVLLAYFLNLALPVALIIGLLTSVVSPAGDLAISLLKRESGVKDSGKMLPGHGGALDRIDSLLWSVTMAYYVVILLV